MMKINEEIYKSVFFNDGSLRDIYIIDTTIDDWNIIWDYIKTLNKVTLIVDGETVISIPNDIIDIFEGRKDKSIFVSFDFNGVNICSHFFCISEIEFDISPKEINNTAKAEAVIKFLVTVSELLNKNVSISLENDKENPLITVGHKGVFY